jgi:hypothetical protein
MPLNKINEMICEAFDLEVHPKHYAKGWYNIIGFGIAIGNDLGSEKLRDFCDDVEDMPEILKFLEERFTSDAWYAPR